MGGIPSLSDHFHVFATVFNLCMLSINFKAYYQVMHKIYALISPEPEIDCAFFLITVRARNVFVNGLFNDPFQALLSYLGLLQFLRNNVAWALAFFSAGISVKLSGALFVPGTAWILFTTSSIWQIFKKSLPGLKLQLSVGHRFLFNSPFAYITRSFELSRRFTWFNVSSSNTSRLI